MYHSKRNAFSKKTDVIPFYVEFKLFALLSILNSKGRSEFVFRINDVVQSGLMYGIDPASVCKFSFL